MKKRLLVTLTFLLALLSLPAAALTATVEARAPAALDPALAATLRGTVAGQPSSVLVILRDQVNPATIGGRNRTDRKKKVVQVLRKKANDTQGSLRTLLQQRQNEGKVQ